MGAPSYQDFIALLQSKPQEAYNLHSRSHALKNTPFASNDAPCFIKRDDELGFGISGSKLRKYSTLIASLKKNKIEHACIMGTFHSNNILGLSQLLIENSIEPHLFLLKGAVPQKPVGNFLLTRLCIAESSIHWIERSEWGRRDQIVEQYTKQWANSNQKFAVIPEGSECLDSFWGALTLGLDIIQNEQDLGITFDNIFIDAGTGLTAQALIIGLGALEKEIHIHVMQAYEDERGFFVGLNQRMQEFKKEWCRPYTLAQCTLHTPTTAKAFGSTNSAIFSYITSFARSEGIVLDPIWSCKLILLVKELLEQRKIIGNTLIIHSGGLTSLFGYQEALCKAIV